MNAPSPPYQLSLLKAQSGLSWEQIAERMGYAGISSLQRYYDPQRTDWYAPNFVRKLEAALAGSGTPPITREQIWSLAGPSFRPPGPIYQQSHIRLAGGGAEQVLRHRTRKSLIEVAGEIAELIAVNRRRELTDENAILDLHRACLEFALKHME